MKYFFFAVFYLFFLLSPSKGFQGEEIGMNLTPEEKKCFQFSVGDPVRMEFYSPMYPNHYPNSSDCILTLTAEFGYMIIVDFRDYFELEDSEGCENDFLEIRDGPLGYSELKGRYCGSDFPPMITSKDRHLWLRFHSDESIQYRGFKAVYKFQKNLAFDRPEIHPCYFEVSGVQGTISDSDIPKHRYNYTKKYNTPLDCTWKITVDPHEKIYLFFEEFKLAEPNECDLNFIDIFGEGRDLSSRMKHFCGSIADPVVTSGNLMYFRYFALREAMHSNFFAYFSAFRDRMEGGSESTCNKDEYDCDDATCIHISLACNGVKNCRHEYDEEGCNNLKKLKFDIRSQHIIIILLLGCVLLGGMCFAMCFNCIRKLIKDGRQIHENLRRSREQLEERSRSLSSASSPQTTNKTEDEIYRENKSNGHMCIQHESEDEDSEVEDEDGDDDEDDDLEEEVCVEMRDCECQTRDSIMTKRNHIEVRTPPPPPPPTRRPPVMLSSNSLHSVPTPPPPPASHYGRMQMPLPGGHYGHCLSSPKDSIDDEASDDSYTQRYRSETVIEMTDRGEYQPTRTGKSTPDVLVTH